MSPVRSGERAYTNPGWPNPHPETPLLADPGDLAGIEFLMGHTVRRNAVGATSLGVNNLHDGVIEHNDFEAAECELAPSGPAGVIKINASSVGVVVRENGGAGGVTV